MQTYGLSEKHDQIDFPVSNVAFYDPKLQETLDSDINSQDNQDLRDVLLHLSLCHSIIIDERSKEYNASSPDELALVNAAKYFGVEFKSQDVDGVLEIDNLG